MEFVGPHGPSVVVDSSFTSQRLQAFVARAFREHLGRGTETIHAACKRAACAAVEQGGVIVNGSVGAGRLMLTTGDVVSLSTAPARGCARRRARPR